MDALSALKMVGTPDLASLKMAGGTDLASQLAAAAQGNGTTALISPAELQQLSPGLTLPAPGAVTGGDGASFQNMLGGLVQEVSEKQAAAGSAVSGLLSGNGVSLHQAMISVEEASVSFQLMVEVRNRLLDSYQELMRMQV
jgi:flagellar hook-basal body complex protein FliE